MNQKTKINKLFLSLVLGLSMGVAHADVTPGQGINLNTPTTEYVTWSGTPIAFAVPVGDERLLSFPSEVEFKNLDPQLTSDKVSITNNAGTLYVRALKPFSPIRTYVEIKSSGQIVYVDLSAQKGGDDNQVSVLTQSKSKNKNTQKDNSDKTASSASPSYISMLQYGIAELYWPERLLGQLNQNPDYFNFARAPMYTTHSVHLVMGHTVLAMPEVSWRNGNLFVTAVLLINPNKQAVKFDPFRDFIGNWDAKAFYPTNYLGPQGTTHDRTVVFLVSDQPFSQALSATPVYRQGESE